MGLSLGQIMGETRSLLLDDILGLSARKKRKDSSPPCDQSHEGEGLVFKLLIYWTTYEPTLTLRQFQKDQSISGSVSVDRSGNCIETSGTSGK